MGALCSSDGSKAGAKDDADGAGSELGPQIALFGALEAGSTALFKHFTRMGGGQYFDASQMHAYREQALTNLLDSALQIAAFAPVSYGFADPLAAELALALCALRTDLRPVDRLLGHAADHLFPQRLVQAMQARRAALVHATRAALSAAWGARGADGTQSAVLAERVVEYTDLSGLGFVAQAIDFVWSDCGVQRAFRLRCRRRSTYFYAHHRAAHELDTQLVRVGVSSADGTSGPTPFVLTPTEVLHIRSRRTAIATYAGALPPPPSVRLGGVPASLSTPPPSLPFRVALAGPCYHSDQRRRQRQVLQRLNVLVWCASLHGLDERWPDQSDDEPGSALRSALDLFGAACTSAWSYHSPNATDVAHNRDLALAAARTALAGRYPAASLKSPAGAKALKTTDSPNTTTVSVATPATAQTGAAATAAGASVVATAAAAPIPHEPVHIAGFPPVSTSPLTGWPVYPVAPDALPPPPPAGPRAFVPLRATYCPAIVVLTRAALLRAKVRPHALAQWSFPAYRGPDTADAWIAHVAEQVVQAARCTLRLPEQWGFAWPHTVDQSLAVAYYNLYAPRQPRAIDVLVLDDLDDTAAIDALLRRAIALADAAKYSYPTP